MSLLERIQKEKSVEVVDSKVQKVKKTQVAQEDPYATIKAKIHSKIIEEIKTDSLKDLGPNDDEVLEEQISAIVENILNEESTYITKNERQKILSEVIDETIGFGPINPLIHDPTVSEIMVNGPNQVYVEKKESWYCQKSNLKMTNMLCM